MNNNFDMRFFCKLSFDVIPIPCPCMHIYIIGLTTLSSTFSSDMSTTVSEPLFTTNSDMSTTVSEPLSTFSSDMPTTVSEAPLPPITTPSTGLSQEILITIVAISCMLAAGLLILLVVQCRRKNKGTPPKNKKNHFANKQNNLTKNFKDDLKSYKPRTSKLIKKRNKKQRSSSIDKKEITELENFASKDRMYQHYPQTTNFRNNSGNQHVFNISHNEGNMMLYGNWHDNYLRPHSRPNNRMLYQSHYPEYPGHNEGLFQNYKADNLYRSRGQQMYQRPYGELYDMHIIDDKQDDKRSLTGRPYEKNWDLLY